jgi:hypothetical protein
MKKKISSDFKDRLFFHEGMRHMQDKFDGRRTADAIEKYRKHYDFWEDEKKIIEKTKFFFIATSWENFVDCSIKSGDEGFVKVFKKGVIEYPEYDGNSMYRTVGNIHKNPNIGMLFVNFDGKSLRTRINGIASIHTDKKTLSRHYGAKFVIRVKCEIYPNCPRYVPDFFNGTKSKYVPREGSAPPPPPAWKERDYIRDILPLDDPHITKIKKETAD